MVDHPTPVGHYSPLGNSTYGVADMAGNIWVWTRSLCTEAMGKSAFEYPYDPGDGREGLGAGNEVARVLRGGVFKNYTALCHPLHLAAGL